MQCLLDHNGVIMVRNAQIFKVYQGAHVRMLGNETSDTYP